MGDLNPFKKPKIDDSAVKEQERLAAQQEKKLAAEQKKKADEKAARSRSARAARQGDIGSRSLLSGLETGTRSNLG